MKKILYIGTHVQNLKERIMSMYKDKLSFLFAETTQNGRDEIAAVAIDIDVVFINISSLQSEEGVAGALDYLSGISNLVWDSLKSNTPVVITCSEPGNIIAEVLDKVISNFSGSENVTVTGKVAIEDIGVLLEESLETTSLKKDATIADLESKEADSADKTVETHESKKTSDVEETAAQNA